MKGNLREPLRTYPVLIVNLRTHSYRAHTYLAI